MRERLHDLFRRWEQWGDWTPAHLTKRDISIVVATMLFTMGVRAFDYIVGNDDKPAPLINGRPPTVAYVTEAFELKTWGWMVVACMALLIVGAAARRHVLVYLGHGFAAVVYIVLFLGTLVPVLERDHLDGIRGASPLFAMTVLHLLFWLRTGPRPLSSEESQVDETTRGAR